LLLALTVVVAALIVGNIQRARLADRRDRFHAPNMSFGVTDRAEPLTVRGLPFRDTQAFWVKMPELERLSHYFLHFDMDVASFKKIQFRLSGPGGAVHFVWEAEQGPLPPENAPVRVSLEVAPATARLLVADQEIAVVQNPPFPQNELEIADGHSEFNLTALHGCRTDGDCFFEFPLAVTPSSLMSRILLVPIFALLLIGLARLRAWNTPEAWEKHLRNLLFAATPLWGGMLLPIALPLDKLLILLIILSLALWLLPRRRLPYVVVAWICLLSVAVQTGLTIGCLGGAAAGLPAAFGAGAALAGLGWLIARTRGARWSRGTAFYRPAILPAWFGIFSFFMAAQTPGLAVILLLIVLLLVWQIIARLGRLSRAYAPAMLALSVLFFAVLELNALHSLHESRWRPHGVGRDFLPHDLLFYTPRDLFSDDNGFSLSRLSFRNRVVPPEKPPNTSRVMVMGGSNVWGQHLGDNRETFSGCLEQCLQAARPGREIQVLNAGVRGYKLYQLLILFQLYGLSYHPDVLVLYINYNDATEQFGPFTYRQLWQMKNEGRWDEVEALRPEQYTPPAWILTAQEHLQKLRLYNGLTLLITGGRLARPPEKREWSVVQDTNPVADYRRNLEDMIALCRAQGVRLLLVDEFDFGYPAVEPNSKVVRIRQAMKDIAAAQGVDYLPLNDMFQTRPDKRELVFSFDEVHLNKQGHRIVAAEICRYLLDHRLADQPTEAAP